MSRYYFDLHNGEGPTTDDEGQEMPSREAVAREITRTLLDIANEEITGSDRLVVTLTVRDDQDRTISVASLIFTNEWINDPQ
ncbi:hypothetical protein [Rhizobium sp. RU36D]|uniref:DUF6894 family protein n=1 Tax=Rhizobium sp. RU36D TaxID=1907415 RepID=UPI000A03C5F1|nr:hypothetical protein [Rhizobium sp. RU36D]